MNLYDVISITSFIMLTITMISYFLHSIVPSLSDVLQIMNILPCYEIKAFKSGKRLNYNELIEYINSPVKEYTLKNGVLYIEIY